MKNLFAILFFILLLMVLQCHQRQNSSSQVPEPLTIHDTVYLPSPVVTKEIPVPVPAKVDTAAILAQYFTKRVFDDTLRTQFVTMHLTDTVYQNTLLGRTASYSFTLPQRHHSLTAGVMAGANTFALMGGYRHKRWTFSGGYDFVNRTPMVGVSYTLVRW